MEQALAELQQPTYDPQLQEEDKVYVAKKLGVSAAEFETLLDMTGRRHEEFGTDEQDLRRLRERMGWIRPLTTLAKKGGWRLDTSVVGARPQFIKAAVVSRGFAAADIEERIVHTGQHYDDTMSGRFLRELGIDNIITNLACGSGLLPSRRHR